MLEGNSRTSFDITFAISYQRYGCISLTKVSSLPKDYTHSVRYTNTGCTVYQTDSGTAGYRWMLVGF